MIGDQLFLFGVLLTVFALLLWGRIRYDVVAFGALIVASMGGAVSQDALFDGFAHPATVIIALVLIEVQINWFIFLHGLLLLLPLAISSSITPFC